MNKLTNYIVVLLMVLLCSGLSAACDRSNEPNESDTNDPIENDSIENDSANNQPVEFGEFVYNDSIKGELKTYKGQSILINGETQNIGLISIVHTSEDKVFLYGLNGGFSNCYGNDWVRGNADNNIISLPNFTEIYYNFYDGNNTIDTHLYLCIILYHPNGEYEDAHDINSIYFKINPDNSIQFCNEFYLSFENGDEYKLAVKYRYTRRDNNGWMTEDHTEYTIVNEYTLTPIDVLPPSGKTWQTISMKYDLYANNVTSSRSTKAQLNIDGNKVYLVVAGCVLRGGISGDEIVFEDKQYVSLPYKFISPDWCGINGNESTRWLSTGELSIEEKYGKPYPVMNPLNLPLKVTYNAKTHELGEADHDFSLGSAIFLNVKFSKSE